MTAIDIELVIAAAAAFLIGSKQKTWPAMLSWSIGLGLSAWLIRCVLIVMYPSDVSVSEDYVNGLTVWSVLVEVAVFTLWTLAWSGFGLVLARRRHKASNVR